MAAGNVTIAGNVSGGPDGARTFGPFSTNISNAVLSTLQVALSSGNNTIAIPTGTSVAIIIPPNAVASGGGSVVLNPSYGGVLTLKGVAGDTGVVVSNYGPTKLDWSGSNLGSPAPPASIVINATVSTTVEIWLA